MNCYQHPEAPAVAYCRSCGRPLCELCRRPAEGTVFCPEHAPVASGYSQPGPGAFDPTNPYASGAVPPPPAGFRTSPVLAFILGWIPGVGAIYNGQYIKGLLHAVIFGMLVSLVDHSGGGPFFGIMLAAFIFYMAFEAYHTAKKRQLGMPITEWSSLAISTPRISSRTPVGPMVLIAVGVLFLLDTLHLIEFREVGRFWPIILIIAGASMLYSRVSCLSNHTAPPASSGTFVEDNTPAANPPNIIMGTRRE
jgi:TM2 domain-containing membrane protein YozV